MEEKADSPKQNAGPPSVTLPKGGGAIRGIGEKFAANPVTGTGSMSVPIAVSPGRSGFGPQLNLSYDSGSGNGPFGFGWSLALPSITRKTDKGLPKYQDAEESDVFILSGAEDLVPALKDDGDRFEDETTSPEFIIHRYRPRIEGLFARVERWTRRADGDMHWRSISRDNITTLYGKTPESRIFDPSDSTHIFSWLICERFDDKGNAIIYKYAAEDSAGVDRSQTHERNRTDQGRATNRYLKRILYGNRTPNRDADWKVTDPTLITDWMFEVVFDYGEHNRDNPQPNEAGEWLFRHDPFSSYRAGFEIRTYRLCQRVLMFHHFPGEANVGPDCLVRSTDFVYRNIRNNPDDLKQGHPVASFIASVTQNGYKLQSGGSYLKKSLPPVEFEYSQVPQPEQFSELPIQVVDEESIENLPAGLDGAAYQWMDLDGEGTSGILTEQADGWYYKRNLSANNQVRENGQEHTIAHFGATEVVAKKPAGGLNGGAQFLDLAGDGQVDLVQMEGSARGFYERTGDADWVSFQPFDSWPNLDTRDPGLKFVDLTGDGHADLLVTESEALTWYPSLAEEGFGPGVRLSLALDEEKGPRLVFSDGTQSIHLADLSGDGLSDLVRIRNGEVCYWPNLGYGRFGAKVTMDNAPWFDAPDQFDQKRIRLADTDGSGTTDILYLRRDGVQIYFNQCGNRWSDAVTLPQFPAIDNIASVQMVDLLGNGTACLVWSSPLPGDAHRPMRYIALMEEKPHLLIEVKNNLGAKTTIHYAPSTKFYLNDRRDGKPWITRLPFPVHVLERVETYDHISRNRFVTRYVYHHGYFDGEEREFRGFGMVEQWDTEEIGTLAASGSIANDDTNWDAASYIPPAYTRTWFHTGAYIEDGNISKQFEHEYYREGDPSLGEGDLTDAQFQSILLPDTVLPDDLTAEETRETCRSLKGAILRQEIYALDKKPDGTPTEKSDRPYSISERNYTIKRLQPKGINKHAVFLTHAREQMDVHYERTLVNVDGKQRADPRGSHAMTLEVDDFGNILRALAIGYRRHDFPGVVVSEQKETHITLTANRFANRPDEADWYRIGLPVETRTYEIVKPPEPTIHDILVQLFKFEQMVTLTNGLFPLDLDNPDESKVWPYEKWDWRNNPSNAPAETRLRLIEHVRTLYRKDDLTAFPPLGDIESLALPGKSYKLAFTPGLLAQTYGGARVANQMLADDGHYFQEEGDTNWWIPSGQIFLSPDTNDLPQQELAYARAHFFLPHRHRDPFHTDAVRTETIIRFDTHNLLIRETRDALENAVIADNDYRVLQPYQVTDPNGNRAQATFNALGMVTATAIMGKAGEDKGDFIDNTFELDPTLPQLQAFIKDPRGNAQGLLKTASTRILYDLDRYQRCGQPLFAAILAREIHSRDSGGDNSPIQIRFGYSDGFGREIQTKVQAEVGEAPQRAADVLLPSGDIKPGDLLRDVNGKIIRANSGRRCVGTGRTVYNNKGKPIKKYEPFFSSTHLYEPEADMTDTGATPILFYDPLERVIATLHPNHSWEKVVFDPWQQATYDVNDTVTFDPKTDADVGSFFSHLPDADYKPTWYEKRISGGMDSEEKSAAKKAARHADTPTVAHFDSLGRTFLTVAHNKFERNNAVVEEKYPTRIVFDIEGNQREVIDAKERVVTRYDYDLLGTQIHSISMDAGERWALGDVTGKPLYTWDSRGFMRRMIYDELQRPTELFVTENNVRRLAERTVYGEAQGDANNHRTRTYQVFDGAGVVTNAAYDFKGYLLRGERQLLQNYKDEVDWSQSPSLESETFTSSTTYDALNRPVTLTTPDNSVIKPNYNEANLLEQLHVNLRGAGTETPFVTNIDYNARGQRDLIEYGNGARTDYEYDEQTFRLKRLITTRLTDNKRLQDLSYTYDPVGNITAIQDDAQQTIFFNNQVVRASAEYIYDALYRLISADGREHIGQNTNAQVDHDDSPRMNRPLPTDGQAMRNYRENYEYDAVGNILNMIHQAADGDWTRRYQYADDSNRLFSTSLPGDPDAGPYSAKYQYDEHGNMKAMPHLRVMEWDFKGQLHVTQQQTVTNGSGERTYYVYDASGQRARKVTERTDGSRKEERICLGGFEIYRKYNGATAAVDLERETLHIMDDKQRIALIETRTQGNDPAPQQLIRYQFVNHLGSESLELDESAAAISYEEYYPYGSTSYQAVHSGIMVSLKRYRFTSKERDEESGLYYHGARYFAPWLGRWASCDPAEMVVGQGHYPYARNNPLRFIDSLGLQAEDPSSPPDFMGDTPALITWKAETSPIAPLGSRSSRFLLNARVSEKIWHSEPRFFLGQPTYGWRSEFLATVGATIPVSKKKDINIEYGYGLFDADPSGPLARIEKQQMGVISISGKHLRFSTWNDVLAPNFLGHPPGYDMTDQAKTGGGSLFLKQNRYLPFGWSLEEVGVVVAVGTDIPHRAHTTIEKGNAPFSLRAPFGNVRSLSRETYVTDPNLSRGDLFLSANFRNRTGLQVRGVMGINSATVQDTFQGQLIHYEFMKLSIPGLKRGGDPIPRFSNRGQQEPFIGITISYQNVPKN